MESSACLSSGCIRAKGSSCRKYDYFRVFRHIDVHVPAMLKTNQNCSLFVLFVQAYFFDACKHRLLYLCKSSHACSVGSEVSDTSKSWQGPIQTPSTRARVLLLGHKKLSAYLPRRRTSGSRLIGRRIRSLSDVLVVNLLGCLSVASLLQT